LVSIGNVLGIGLILKGNVCFGYSLARQCKWIVKWYGECRML